MIQLETDTSIDGVWLLFRSIKYMITLINLAALVYAGVQMLHRIFKAQHNFTQRNCQKKKELVTQKLATQEEQKLRIKLIATQKMPASTP